MLVTFNNWINYYDSHKKKKLKKFIRAKILSSVRSSRCTSRMLHYLPAWYDIINAYYITVALQYNRFTFVL